MASPRGAAAAPPRVPFSAHRDDATTSRTVLSVLAGAHSVGAGLLGFFDTRGARALRLVCTELHAAVTACPWADAETRIARRLDLWRACFPAACAANISVEYGAPKNAFVDADFAHLAGIHTLNMSWCSQAGITDAAFAHLAGIHTLNMSHCKQEGITDAAFSHHAGIHTLDMWGCYQTSITDAAFSHLAGIHTLNMRFCTQAGLTDAAFAHLAGIHTLDMSYCTQASITDAAFAHLAGIHTLIMSFCSQAGITGAAFAHLAGIRRLVTIGCSSYVYAAAKRVLAAGHVM